MHIDRKDCVYGKAFAPEYQGALTTLSVNSSLTEVLAAGTEQLRAAEPARQHGEAARCGLAVAEAHRRLGRIGVADRAWKASYRAARAAGDLAAMAWALWSGGTLARQRGAFALVRRLLELAADLGERGGDIVVRGYSPAGLAETGRIQGDYEAVGRLHEQLLAEARRRGEARHTVWALEGIAQIHRNTGSYDTAYALFEEAAGIADGADDRRGHAWALRALADVVSAHVVTLIEEAGGRTAALAEARRHLAAVETALAGVPPGTGPRARAAVPAGLPGAPRSLSGDGLSARPGWERVNSGRSSFGSPDRSYSSRTTGSAPRQLRIH